MCALGHYLEDEGIATVVIALYRLHAEKIKAPRALWVPFELGRPLGPPNDVAFQRRVIERALELLSRTRGPVLEDFPDDAPDAMGDPDWQCPVKLEGDDLVSELESVRPWFERALEKRGFSTVGVSGVPIEVAAAFLAGVDTDDPLPNPRQDLADVQLMRFSADDLKAYYLEAAIAGEGSPSSRQLTDWFWTKTIAARTLLSLRTKSVASDDDKRRLAKGWLVPVARLEPEEA